MKKKSTILISVFTLVVLCLCVSSCAKPAQQGSVWAEAIYVEDAEFGSGEKSVLVEVIAEDKSVTFTIHSDKSILGDALAEHNIIDGEKGPYGLYVKKVNGIEADYDKNNAYWGINKNGESLLTGVDGVEFKGGEHYEFVYTK